MKKKRFTEQQIAFALRQAEQGTAVEEITRKLGVSEANVVPLALEISPADLYRFEARLAESGILSRRPELPVEGECPPAARAV